MSELSAGGVLDKRWTRAHHAASTTTSLTSEQDSRSPGSPCHVLLRGSHTLVGLCSSVQFVHSSSSSSSIVLGLVVRRTRTGTLQPCRHTWCPRALGTEAAARAPCWGGLLLPLRTAPLPSATFNSSCCVCSAALCAAVLCAAAPRSQPGLSAASRLHSSPVVALSSLAASRRVLACPPRHAAALSHKPAQRRRCFVTGRLACASLRGSAPD